MMKRGNSLVGLLVVVAIIALLAVTFMKGSSLFSAPGTGSPRKDGLGTTVPGLIMAQAKDDACRARLYDLRAAIHIAEGDNDDKPPSTLAELKQGEAYAKCPIGGEAYKYNAETGEVKCVHPGHEKY